MKLINLLCLFLILLYSIPVFCQSNADYFPYKKNNYWEYLWLAGPFGQTDTIVSFSVFDSIDTQGNKISIFDSHFINPITPPVMLPDSGTYIIDSTLNVFSNWAASGSGCTEQFILVYKLNGKQGEQWVMCDLGNGNGYEMARIKEIYNDSVLGVATNSMLMHYYLAADSTDTTGLDRGYEILAKGFGLKFRQTESFYGISLKGAVIDGILYGDTTVVSVEKNHIPVPSNFELFQNYPNPFNPSTTIKFSLNTGGNISLIIYDVLGNEVIRLIDNEYYSPGRYQENWDGINLYGNILASGVFFYQLSQKNYSLTRSMLLLK